HRTNPSATREILRAVDPPPNMAGMSRHANLIVLLASLAGAAVFAQEPVKGVANPETLFTDKNAQLNTNKQAALHIMKDLLQCNHWDEADKWLTARYVQHNPNVTSGRDAVVKFFGSRPKTPTCDRLATPVVAVLADGDVVTVVIARE